MLRAIEALLDPTGGSPSPPPGDGLLRFYWHFIRQARGPVTALFAAGLLVAALDTTIPLFIGRVVGFVSTYQPGELFARMGFSLLGMAAVLLLGRPSAMLMLNLVTNQVVNPGLSNLIRWQNHWHVVRQSWTFFQNDFAGRVASRVMQTGPSLRESVVSAVNAIWYLLVYGSSAMLLLGRTDARLAVPILIWFAVYAALLRLFVPRMRDRSRAVSEVRSTLTGRVVDSYTNILTVKLFARARDEDDFVRSAVDEHTAAFRNQTRMATGWSLTLGLLNGSLIVGTGSLALWLWSAGRIPVATVATALPMAWQISNMAGWVSQNVTSLFENVGIVQDGMRSIDIPRQMPDRRTPRSCGSAAARSASIACASATAPRAACCTASTSPSRPASASA